MKKHILLIDDDKDELSIFLDALRQVPSDDGFKCTYAGSTLKAADMLKFLVPDFIFIDYNVPMMNGVEFIGFVNGQPALRKTTLCLYSTHISTELRRVAQSLGATCMQKTTTIGDLSVRLTKLFRRGGIQEKKAITFLG